MRDIVPPVSVLVKASARCPSNPKCIEGVGRTEGVHFETGHNARNPQESSIDVVPTVAVYAGPRTEPAGFADTIWPAARPGKPPAWRR